MSNIEVFLDAYGELRRVGLLRRYAGARRERVTYEHDPDWLAAPEAFQFDPTLPLVRGPISTPGNKEMFGTLGDSAPDTWGRELMRDLSRIHQAYQLGLREHLGLDPFAGSEGRVAKQRAIPPAELAALARQYLLQDDWLWVLAGGGLQ